MDFPNIVVKTTGHPLRIVMYCWCFEEFGFACQIFFHDVEFIASMQLCNTGWHAVGNLSVSTFFTAALVLDHYKFQPLLELFVRKAAMKLALEPVWKQCITVSTSRSTRLKHRQTKFETFLQPFFQTSKWSSINHRKLITLLMPRCLILHYGILIGGMLLFMVLVKPWTREDRVIRSAAAELYG